MHDVAFHPTKNNILASCSSNESTGIILWNTDTGKELWTADVGSAVSTVQFSPCGDTIAAGCGNGDVQLIDVATAQVRRSLHAHSHMVASVSFSPDGQRLVSGSDDNTVTIWDSATGKCL